jgi:hypothetical protein
MFVRVLFVSDHSSSVIEGREVSSGKETCIGWGVFGALNFYRGLLFVLSFLFSHLLSLRQAASHGDGGGGRSRPVGPCFLRGERSQMMDMANDGDTASAAGALSWFYRRGKAEGMSPIWPMIWVWGPTRPALTSRIVALFLIPLLWLKGPGLGCYLGVVALVSAMELLEVKVGKKEQNKRPSVNL